MDDLAGAAFAAYLDAKARMYGQEPGFLVERVGPLWCLRNHPGWPERDAYYGLRVGPDPAFEAVARDGAPPGHRVTLLQAHEDGAPPEIRGYRREPAPQPFLCRRLGDETYVGPRAEPVGDEAGLAFINAPDPYMSPDDLRSGVYRYYHLAVDGVPACRGRCLDIRDAVYMTGLDTLPAFRRRGLGHALMRTMESDAAERGKEISLLWSSDLGRSLYRALGYEEGLRTDVYDFGPSL